MKWAFKNLPIITLSYLSVPLIIFSLGWIKPYYSIPFSIIIIAGLVFSFLDNKKLDREKLDSSLTEYKYLIYYILALSVLFIWLYYSGIGGFSFQNSDWYKHNAILHHLIYDSWPIKFPEIANHSNSALVYYTGYYLPAALFGKLYGWLAANTALFIWSFLGISLAFLWLCRLSKRFSLWLIVAFIFFGGLDVLGNLILNDQLIINHVSNEWWAGFWQYSSNTTQLYWVPQQAIPAWLIASLLTFDYLTTKNNRNIFFYLAISIIWSPLVSIGLLPFALLGIFSNKFKKVFSYQNFAVAPLVAIVFGLFFLANLQSQSNEPSTVAWLWQEHDIFEILPRLTLFYLIEFAVFALICWKEIVNSDKIKKLWWYLAIIFLLFAPFFKFGLFNDFAMRSTLPSLFIILILISKTLTDKEKNVSLAKALIVIVLIITSSGTYSEIARARINNPPNPSYASDLTLESLEPGVVGQYLGNQDSVFYKYLSR